KKDRDLPLLSAGSGLQPEQFFYDALVCSKSDRVSEEPGHGAELTTVGAASSGLYGDQSKRAPPSGKLLKDRCKDARHHVELIQIHRLPGNGRIRLQAGLAFFSCFVDREVNVFELAARCIGNDLWPRLISFTKRDCVGVLRTAGSPECFVGHFSHVRPAHHNRHSNGSNGISHSVRLLNHPCHSAYTNQVDLLLADISRNSIFVHSLSVSIYQQNFVFRRG